VVLDEEIGSGILIGQLSWMVAPSSVPPGGFVDVEVWMGLCASDYLGSNFLDNYIPGTRSLVFQADTLTLDGSEGEWISIELTEPFQYDGSQNLLIEVLHSPGEGGIYSWSWEAGPGRSLSAWSVTSPNGSLQGEVPMMILSEPAGLEPATFGSIKRIFLLP
jgi:hypothetical protein